MLLLLLAIACHSPAGKVYDQCVEHYETLCECGNYEGNPEDPEWACEFVGTEQGLYRTCAQYDLRTCDPDDAEHWDAQGCEDVHDNVEERESDGSYDYLACLLPKYRAECPGPEASVEIHDALYAKLDEACADLIPVTD